MSGKNLAVFSILMALAGCAGHQYPWEYSIAPKGRAYVNSASLDSTIKELNAKISGGYEKSDGERENSFDDAVVSIVMERDGDGFRQPALSLQKYGKGELLFFSQIL